MSTIAPGETVADLVLEQPTRAQVFERFGIDYCCGGRVPLDQACAERGLELAAVLAALDEPLVPGAEDVDWRERSVADLVGHVVGEHHGYLRGELPPLRELADKVARVHGDSRPELHEVRTTFAAVADELELHMEKEEQILFPACVAIEAGQAGPFPFGSVAAPISMMIHEHDEVAAGLARLRELTDGFTPPVEACTSYRALYGRLRTLDADTRRHVHEENNILFPRALELESHAV